MKRPSSASSSDAASTPAAAPPPRKPGLLRWFAGVAFVAALAIAGQFAVDALFPPPPSGYTIRNMSKQCRNTIVFLGDSINASFAKDDEKPKTLATLVGLAADHHIGAVALGGYDMQLFRDYVRSMQSRMDPDRPQIWLLTVNLSNYARDGRSPRIRNQLHIAEMNQLLHRTRRAFARPMRIFRFPSCRPTLREEEELRRPVLWQGRPIGLQRDFPDTHFKVSNVTDDLRRQNVIIRYAQPMTRGNRALKATTEAARILRRHGQRAVFCIMPCDVERCDALLDGAISPILDEKAALARAAAEAGGGEVLDLHDAFPHKWFVPDRYPNEHLRNPGREALASAIASFLLTNTPPAPVR